LCVFFFSSRRRHTRFSRDWSSDVCSSDLLVLPTAVPVFNVILLMNFFRGIPKELEEAAYMDGAGAWQILIKIFIPISTPAIATEIGRAACREREDDTTLVTAETKRR